MIIKSITSKTPRFLQLLDYLTLDEEKTINQHGETFVLKKFLNGQTNKEMAKEFLKNEEKRLHRRANNSKLIHEVISFSELDRNKITVEHLKTLTEAYLQKRSPLIQAFAIGHFDQDHYHCHIISSPVDITGRNLRMSKEEFGRTKIEMQELQKEIFPELENSLVQHGRKQQAREKGKSLEQENNKEKTMAIHRPSQVSNKAMAREAIESCMIMAESKEDFFEQLSQSGFSPYKRGTDYKGITHNDKNYRFTTLINDYAERFDYLDLKQERVEDIRDIRSANEGREQEHENERGYYNPEDVDNENEEE